MNNNLNIWNAAKSVPSDAQKKIKGGRLNGFTDINPQWRLAKMTEIFGPIGIGWYYEIDEQWVQRDGDIVCAFTNIKLYIKQDGEWSMPIWGTGGSMLAAKEKSGIHVSDECYKMSLTDALSVAMKQLGVGAEVYSNYFDFTTKHSDPQVVDGKISDDQADEIDRLITETGSDLDAFLKYFKADRIPDIAAAQYKKAVAALQSKLKKG